MTIADAVDRYVTFADIDCDGRTRRTMAAIEAHAAASASPFWAYFEAQRRLAHGRGLRRIDHGDRAAGLHQIGIIVVQAGDDLDLDSLFALGHGNSLTAQG